MVRQGSGVLRTEEAAANITVGAKTGSANDFIGKEFQSKTCGQCSFLHESFIIADQDRAV